MVERRTQANSCPTYGYADGGLQYIRCLGLITPRTRATAQTRLTIRRSTTTGGVHGCNEEKVSFIYLFVHLFLYSFISLSIYSFIYLFIYYILDIHARQYLVNWLKGANREGHTVAEICICLTSGEKEQ